MVRTDRKSEVLAQPLIAICSYKNHITSPNFLIYKIKSLYEIIFQDPSSSRPLYVQINILEICTDIDIQNYIIYKYTKILVCVYVYDLFTSIIYILHMHNL